ncbi:protein FAR-RED IMPAIRED RESPONSE 1-like [Aegilops tauschii subsp. strangulata]|uniref:protein FAR-RED IMPAIRED RESPONSE 1-like n=1 Tax=Aegilops tauschii subsp. strangulata TaxID=200361 RepID=UPI00098A1910|nr:protein FAR-RED IMPAIRED RESPONSE 1-like [Aegilops tauschii subsp. strangulata]
MAPPPKNMPKHARRRTQQEFDEPRRYGAPPGWPPNIEAYVLPRLEMRFETFKEAKDYNVYAKHAGFAIREGSKFKTRAYLYCTCYGVYESKVSEANRQRNKTTARTNCGTKMRLKMEKDGTLVVKEIVWEHNHRLQLTPQMLVFLHCHKNFDKTILEYVKYLQFKGIEHVQIMSILGGDDPGSYFLKMNVKELINIKAKNSRMDDVDDVLKAVNFFRKMKAINREFFCDMQLDESDRVKNIQAAEGPIRTLTTFFGFALIRDEDADSFRWLFKTFLRCIRRKAPTCILTDQCPAMALAIPDAFGNMVHKLCRWHIMKKYREHLAYLYNLHKEFKDEFTSILNWPLMPTEFEAAWKRLVDKYNLHDDATMVGMWNERERWISAYFKEIFCAKMTSTQRSESMNYVLKKNFVSERENLHRFVGQKEQNTLTFYGFDTQMAKLYPRAVYSEIRNRLKLSTLFTATETEEPTKYLVHYNNPQKLSVWAQHAFQTIKAASVPKKYILRRYTKRPNIQPTFNRNDLRTVASNKASQYCIESSLLTLNMRVHRKSLRSQEQMARSRVIMDKLEQELDAMHSAENGGVADNEAIEQDIATMLSEMNHLGAIDPFDNEEEEQQ